MSFIYVAGVAGSGKSAIAKALGERDFSAYDEDAPGVGAAHNKQTGLSVQIPSVEQRTPDWFNTHEWRIVDKALADLVSRAVHEDIVLCGNSLTDAALQAIDATVLYLRIDDATLATRINDRTDNDYGKSENELAEIRERHRAFDERFLNRATVIDATRPLESVVNDVIELGQISHQNSA